ncbi:MAG: carbohydrate ABC transporter permease [Micromonosporaceae bacterium]
MTAQAVATTRPAVRTRRRRSGKKIASKTAFFVLIAIFVVISLFPFYWIVITSLKTDAAIAKGTTSLLPGHISLGAYKADFTKSAGTSAGSVSFAHTLLNSAIVALSATVIAVILGSLAGYGLARTRLRGRPVILGFILIAGFFPPIALVGPMFLSYRRIGLLDTYPGLIISYLIYTLPIAIWLLTNYFSQIPAALEEAAIVDGATRLQALRRVIIPVALPGVFTATIISFILAWNDFLFALMFMTSPNHFTAPLAIVNLGKSQYQVFYNRIDAAVVALTIPVALIVIFAQKRIISGLTAGALK